MKKLFFALAATVALLGTQSCSKKDTVTPEKDIVAELSQQVKFTVSEFNYEEADILPIVSGQYGQVDQQPTSIELSVNSTGATEAQTRFSLMRCNAYGIAQTMSLEKIDKNTVLIDFKNNAEMYAGATNGTPFPSQKLLSKNLLVGHFNNGGNGGWFSFSANQLTGLYTVEEIETGSKVTGYKFSKKGSTAWFSIAK